MDSLTFHLQIARTLETVLDPSPKSGAALPAAIDFSTVLQLVDRFFSLQASFLFVKKPASHEDLIVRGSTSQKVTPFARGNVDLFESRFLNQVVSREVDLVEQDRFRYSNDLFWELLWRTMEMGPYTGPWNVVAAPIAFRPGDLKIADVQGFLILVFARGNRCWTESDDNNLRLVAAQLSMAIEWSISAQSLKDQQSAFFRTLTNAGQDVQLHSIFSPLQRVELFAEKAERAMRRHEHREVLSAIDSMRRYAFEASRFAKSILQRSQSHQSTNPKLPHCDVADVMAVIESSYRPYANDAGKDLVIRIESAVTVAISPPDLEEVLGNLIHNAIKYGERNTKIKVTSKSSGDYAVIDVTSYGIEIRNEDRERVFMLGYRTPEAALIEYNAVGLGLYRARELAECARGQLYMVTSVPDEKIAGAFRTTFRLRVPLK